MSLNDTAPAEQDQTRNTPDHAASRCCSSLKSWAVGYPMAALLLIVLYGLTVSAGRTKSICFDEMAHITGGYTYWLRNDFRFNPETANLPQRLAGLPLVLDHLNFPDKYEDSWRDVKVWSTGWKFLYHSDNDVSKILLYSRSVIALLSVATGLLVYAWSRRLFGPGGGMISLLLYLCCPPILAHGGLATSDITAAFFFSAALWTLWNVYQRVSLATVLLSSLAIAGLFVSKMSAVVLGPVGLVLLALRIIWGKPLVLVWRGQTRLLTRRGWQLAVLLLVALAQTAAVVLVIWASFSFRFSTISDNNPTTSQIIIALREKSQQSGPLKTTLGFMLQHRLLPEGYLDGFASMLFAADRRCAFLNGEWSLTGWRHFFPYCFLVKEPIPALLLLILALLAWVLYWPAETSAGAGRFHRAEASLYASAPLWLFLAAYWAAAISSHLNIGDRHILPVYPATFILAGGLAAWLTRRWRQALVLLLLLALLVETHSRWPHYLSYVNQIAGGPRHGYRHLVDSSIDWGQDLPGLRDYLDRHGYNDPDHPQACLAYFGTGSPEYYGIHAQLLPGYFDQRAAPDPAPLRGGIYCISVTMLQGDYFLRARGNWTDEHERIYQTTIQTLALWSKAQDDPAARKAILNNVGVETDLELLEIFDQYRFARLCAYLRNREPDDFVGYSILIYKLSDAMVQDALLGRPPYPRR